MPKLSEIELETLASRLILAMMSSASTDKIRPVDWWKRAQDALQTSAGKSQNMRRMISEMGRKLQIDVLSPWSAKEVSSISDAIGDDFPAFRTMCTRDYLVLTSMAMLERDRRKAERVTNADEAWDAYKDGKELF